MKTVVKFNTLEELVKFTKKIDPQGYRMNTIDLSLSAGLSSLECAIAVEQFGAKIVWSCAVACERS